MLTTLKNSQFILLKLNEAGTAVADQKVVLEGFGRLRDVCVAPDGRIFVCTSSGNDRVIEIKGKPGTSVNTEDKDSGGFLKASPNPFSNTTTLEFFLKAPGEVEISLYNAIGEKVTTLFKGFKDAGKNTFPVSVESGSFYVCRVQSGSSILTTPLLKLR